MAWNPFAKKAYPAPGASGYLINVLDATVGRTIQAYYTEGYAQNPIVYSCVSVIAKNAASVKLEIISGKDVLTEHPLLSFLSKPNPTQSWAEFIKEAITYYLVAGEAFVLRLPSTGKAMEIYNLDPRHMEVEMKDSPVPVAYGYGTGEKKARYTVNKLTGESQVKHIKKLNLNSHGRGMSPLSAAAVQIDTHNAGAKWNYSLLKNGARPSGIIQFTGTVAEDTLTKFKDFFFKSFQGSSNRGAVPILTGGAEFKPLSLNPVDMDFTEGMNSAAKDIALILGVPLPLVTTDAATFSNMEAALERLWTDTVLPLLDEVIGDLSDFLTPMYGKGLKLTYNADSVPALEAKRARKYDRMVKVVAGGILTPNEARAELGFDPADGGDELRKGSQPADPKADMSKALRLAGYSDAEIAAELEANGV